MLNHQTIAACGSAARSDKTEVCVVCCVCLTAGMEVAVLVSVTR